ncbi:Reverse transcriptase zinc-binding domain [Macleaya cordata]|uniref:Reverse transcriptase zinc-binding domain n=1 Tax=Macleaya cordata TaxID=56857 RepID=A0A200QG95_MACCD|nr:Reverse transcriptase zinc-binding domain [Macleaya cordata]
MSGDDDENRAWDFGFSRTIRNGELPMLAEFIQIIGDPPNMEEAIQEDRREWKPDNKEIFTANSCYQTIMEGGIQGNTTDFPYKLVWCKDIPTKVSFFTWVAALNSIPTLDMLQRRGHPLCSICFLCGAETESDNHILMHCQLSFQIWLSFLEGFRMEWVMPGTILQLLSCWEKRWNNIKENFVWKVMPFAIGWILWNERNARIFDNKIRGKEALIVEIKSCIFLWGTARGVFKGIFFDELVTSWREKIHCM